MQKGVEKMTHWSKKYTHAQILAAMRVACSPAVEAEARALRIRAILEPEPKKRRGRAHQEPQSKNAAQNVDGADGFIKLLADAIAARVSTKGPAARRLLTVAGAAEYIGRTPHAVEMLISRGVIPVTRLDGRSQIDRDALDKLIADRTYFET
jgi:excisionase family DNA binding protein